jgi:amino acid transporter
MNEPAKISWKTALGLVLSNTIGTGVFTSLGYQLPQLHSTWTILLLWLLGGVLALMGAFTYAELGTHYRQRGGDFIFISEGFHPLLGYLSAWTSLVVGFSAPIAIGAIAMADYLKPLQIPHLRWGTMALILLLCVFHSGNLRISSKLQDLTTLFKMLFVGLLLVWGLVAAPSAGNALSFNSNPTTEIFSSSFAVALLYVYYAYNGWNAAAYIVDEIDRPRQNLPKALIWGTAIVTALYMSLQLIFLKFASLTELSGKTEVALIAGRQMVGASLATWIGIGIALQLVATISSYIWVGSRIVHSMSLRYRVWSALRPTNAGGIPVRAVWAIGCVALLLMNSGKLDQVLVYTSFLLQLMGTIGVASLLRTPRQPTDFPSPYRPYLQWVFIIFNLVVLGFIFSAKPLESLLGLGTLVLGAATYAWEKWQQ